MSDIPLKSGGTDKELTISMKGKVVAIFPIDLGTEPLTVTLTGVTPDQKGNFDLPPNGMWELKIDKKTTS